MRQDFRRIQTIWLPLRLLSHYRSSAEELQQSLHGQQHLRYLLSGPVRKKCSDFWSKWSKVPSYLDVAWSVLKDAKI